MGPIAERIMFILNKDEEKLKNFFIDPQGTASDINSLRRMFSNHLGEPPLSPEVKKIFTEAVKVMAPEIKSVLPIIDSKNINKADQAFNAGVNSVIKSLSEDQEWKQFFDKLTLEKQQHLTKSIEASIILQLSGSLVEASKNKEIPPIEPAVSVYLNAVANMRDLPPNERINKLKGKGNILKKDEEIKQIIENVSSVYNSLKAKEAHDSIFSPSVSAFINKELQVNQKELLLDIQTFKKTMAEQLLSESKKVENLSIELTEPYKKMNNALESTLLVLHSYENTTDNLERVNVLLGIKNKLKDIVESKDKDPEKSTKQLQGALKEARLAIYQQEQGKSKFLGTFRAKNSTLLKSIESALKQQGVSLSDKSPSTLSFSKLFKLKEKNPSPTQTSADNYLSKAHSFLMKLRK